MKKISLLFLCLTALTAFAVEATSPSPRERLLLDANWKFHLGNEWGSANNLSKAGTGNGPAGESFNTASWRTVNLPHDWAVELPFAENADGSHGFKAVGPGFPQNNIGWYRREFALTKTDAGKRLWLEFDGVYRDCVVFVNGWNLGRQESGYSSFRLDITDVANCDGKNVVAVKVDASEAEGWFYEGAGIYRHVWLVKTAPVAIAPDGVFVFTKFDNNVPSGAAEVVVQTALQNTGNSAAETSVRCAVVAPDGKTVVAINKSTRVAAHSLGEVESSVKVSTPVLWSPESPKLYKHITTVEVDGKIVDRQETEFGIRTVAFDADKGFLLNGQPYVLKGTCNHQDHAGVGAALPDRLQYFRIAKLKEMGDNAYRCSHNPPTPELLEACDRLGMLVMDENRLLGSDAQNLERMERLIRRDRNHPSVAIWSIANEEFTVQYQPVGGRVGATMQTRVQQLDPTRPVTCAANMGDEYRGINPVIEVRGWNYHISTNNMDTYHAAHPHQPNVGTEQASTVSTRGIYANDKTRGYVSAYDDNKTEWSNLAEEWWPFFAARPWLSGGFIWTGFDYRGEPTPYSWPCINSHFGVLDTCGFPKDNFYYYQAWWSDKTVLHLLPHWNWPGKEGQEIDVRCFSNCEEVELSLNGQSLGRQTMKKNSHLRWKVKYAPGTLNARGFKGGKQIAEEKIETTGAATAVQLTPDRATIHADGEDVSVFTVSIRDAAGRIVPTAGNFVQFKLEGPGKIIGVGNGDPSCHEPDIFLSQPKFNTQSITGARFSKVSSPGETNQPALAAKFDDSAWAVADVADGNGLLDENENAVFRARFVVAPETAALPIVELNIGRIDDEGLVYLNGIKVGESHEWRVPAIFDVKRFLHAGTNTLAILAQNHWGRGGVNQGIKLMAHDNPPPPDWQRSAFNGLAQIIVQSTKTPGEIRLTAQSEGLQSVTSKVEATPTEPRPQVP